MESDKNLNFSKKEIDLCDLGKKLWDKRRFIIKVSLIGLAIGVITAFSIPKEYTTTVILAPESSSSSSGNMGALAAIAGINFNVSTNDLSSDIYPDIIKSTPFLLGLSKIKISDTDTTLYTYLNTSQKIAWWSYILGAPRLLLGLFSTKEDSNAKDSNAKERRILSIEELNVVGNLKNRIQFSIDAKSGVITLTSTMQNSKISAFVADTLTSYLQSYIISYRTEKARADLSFTEKLYRESKVEYEKVQKNYAEYLDKNQNVILASFRVNQEKLQNEVNLAYVVYNQMAQQLQLAKVKVQDQTPVYTTIQPPIVPIIPSKPNKKLIIVGFIFLFAISGCSFILGKEFLKNLKS